MEDYNEKERIIDMESPKLKTLNITSPSERVVEELRSPSELEKMEFRGDEVVYEDGVTDDLLKNMGDVEVEMFERDFSRIKIKEILENLKDVRNNLLIPDKTELFVGVNNYDGHEKIKIFSVGENGNVRELSDDTAFRKEFQIPKNPFVGIDGYKRDFTHLISETQLINHIERSQILRNSNPDVGGNRFSTIDHEAFEAWEMSQYSPYDKKDNDVETVQINSEDSALIESIVNQNRNRGKGIFAKIKNNLAGRGF